MQIGVILGQQRKIMGDKYYVPTIEEFHVGFECESNYGLVNNKEFPESSKFIKYTFTQEDISYMLDAYENDAYPTEFRVKYLDREDIESLGWVFNNEHKFYTFYLKGGYRLAQSKTDNDIVIEMYVINDDGEPESFHRLGTAFSGNIKNKSELIVLLKQLDLDGKS
jgi:hypothetical protein